MVAIFNSIGSVVAFDYFTTEPLESNSLYWRFGRWASKAAGEPIKFGIDSTPPSRERVAELLQSCGLSLVEQRTLGRLRSCSREVNTKTKHIRIESESNSQRRYSLSKPRQAEVARVAQAVIQTILP